MRAPSTIIIFIFLLLGFNTTAVASWSEGTYTRAFGGPYFDTIEPGHDVAPDGLGGVLAMRVWGSTVRASRIDASGETLWGTYGVTVPRDPSYTTLIVTNCAIASDGMGGAYCAWIDSLASNHLFLSRLDPQGNQVWRIDAEDLGQGLVWLGLEAVPVDDGSVWIGYSSNNTSNSLRAARYGPGQEFYGSNDLTVFGPLSLVNRATTYLVADGSGGLLAGVWTIVDWVTPSLSEVSVLAQRLSPNATKMWGASGTLLWTSNEVPDQFLRSVDVVADGAGGAFVTTDQGGVVLAQHLDGSGATTWAPGGVNVHAVPAIENLYPRACSDGAAGVIVAHNDPTTLSTYAQRIDINGSLLWPQGATAGVTRVRDVASDERGGLLFAYSDWTLALGATAGAVRIDGSGNIQWQQELLTSGTDDIRLPRAVADGQGGGFFAYPFLANSYTIELRIYGVDAAGYSPPLPVLTLASPDGVEPDQSEQMWITGNYLDPSQVFVLHNPATGFDVPIVGVTTTSPLLASGSANFTGAPEGAYDLIVTEPISGLDVTLEDAVGVGYMTPCDTDERFDSPQPVSAFPDGSARKAGFDPQGNASFAWIESDGGAPPTYWVRRWLGDSYGGTVTDEASSDLPMASVTHAVGPAGEAHFAYTQQHLTLADDLVYLHAESGGSWSATMNMLFLDPRTPVMVVDGNDVAHIVFEAGGQLVYTSAPDEATGLTLPVTVTAEGNPREPDLDIYGIGLILTYVRDSVIPGISEVVYQEFDGMSWTSPQSLHFGVTVRSPSVAWDGGPNALFAWIVDNSGTQPLVHTRVLTSLVGLSPVRFRLSENPWVDRVVVDAVGTQSFYLLTQERPSQGTTPVHVNLRGGTGRVFYAKRRLNTGDDVNAPAVFAAGFGGDAIGAWWGDATDPVQPLHEYLCFPSMSPCVPPQVITFDGDGMVPPFTWGGTCGTVTEENSKLVHTKNDGCVGQTTYSLDPAEGVLCGDFFVTIDFDLGGGFPVSADGSHVASLGLRRVSDNAHIAGVNRINQLAMSNPCLSADQSYGGWVGEGNGVVCNQTLVATTDQIGRFRLERAGNVIAAYYWSNDDWQPLTFGLVTTGPLWLWVSTGTGGAETAGHVVGFDNLAINVDVPGGTASDGIVTQLQPKLQVSPNPFNPATRVTYTVPEAGVVTLRVFDARGRQVETILDREPRDVGEYDFLYTPALSSGVYLLHLESGGKAKTTKITVLK